MWSRELSKFSSSKIFESLEKLLGDTEEAKNVVYTVKLAHERNGYSGIIDSIGQMGVYMQDIKYDLLDLTLPILTNDECKARYFNIMAGYQMSDGDYKGALASLECAPQTTMVGLVYKLMAYFILGHGASFRKELESAPTEIITQSNLTLAALTLDEDPDLIIEFLLNFGGLDGPLISAWVTSPFVTRLSDRPKFDLLMNKLERDQEERLAIMQAKLGVDA